MGAVALDGTKIHANASRHNALSYEHAGKIEAQLQAEVGTLRFTDLRIGLDWFGTTSLRLCYALGRFLPYITGGVSYGQVTASGSQLVLGAAGTVFGSASTPHAGSTAGAGSQYAVAANISVK